MQSYDSIQKKFWGTGLLCMEIPGTWLSKTHNAEIVCTENESEKYDGVFESCEWQLKLRKIRVKA